MGKQKQGKRILKVTIRREVEVNPDLSYLGKYTSEPGDEAHTVDREERGDCKRGEFRYFVAAMSGAETGNPASVEEDYRRMEAYNNDDWCMIGVQAEAEVQLKEQGVVQTVCSGGLWGIESDSDDGHFERTESDELAMLGEELSAMGFGAKEIKTALKGAKRREG